MKSKEIWIAVTDDVYELPVCWGNDAKELAKRCHFSCEDVKQAYKQKRKIGGVKIQCVSLSNKKKW